MAALLTAAIDSMRDRSLILFGGKGGVGKTTIASLAALRTARFKETVLFSSDPASNLGDLFGEATVEGLTIEQVDAESLYRSFLDANLESFLELGDRGTYLDREELRRFFELAVPGIDELMAWMRIGDLASERTGRMVVVDSAPTGHTLRMLRSSEQFLRFGDALDSMQEKHRVLVEQLTRRRVRDAIDAFVERFQTEARSRAAFLTDRARTAFVPVFLAEPWVVEQTARLAAEVREQGLDVPLFILNRSAENCDCARCALRRRQESEAKTRLDEKRVVAAHRSCTPLDDVERLEHYLSKDARPPAQAAVREGSGLVTDSRPIRLGPRCRALFVGGKGGVGKTTAAVSIGLQLAESGKRTTIISIDPAHGLRDTIATIHAPANLQVEFIDTHSSWNRLRAEIGDEVERALAALAPKGFHVAHDGEVMRQLIDIAPPGADELFAIIRLHDLLLDDERPDFVVIDTAPTGHFLRFLELPRTATEWVREFMRILLRYSELIPTGRLGSDLVRSSRALAAFDAVIRSRETAAVVVTRPEKLVLAETSRLLERLGELPMEVAGVVANYLAPLNDCPCDAVRREAEENALLEFSRAGGATLWRVEEQDEPVTDRDRLRALVPIVLTSE